MTGKLALPTMIALCSIALSKPTVSSLAVLGEISIGGAVAKVENLANVLQVCLDSGAKKVLLSANSSHPRMHITETTRENPMTAPLFCMVLRKHLAAPLLNQSPGSFPLTPAFCHL